MSNIVGRMQSVSGMHVLVMCNVPMPTQFENIV
jgi:hypothetical protein